MDRLDAMSTFVAVCDAEGFASAARRLGISPSMATRQVARLESELGVRLLDRTTRSIRLTEAGVRYLERVRRILAEIEEASELARDEREEPRGRLAIAAPLVFGRMHVAPLLAAFMARHPDIEASLVLSDRNAQLLEEGLDLAIRLGPIEQPSMIARKLGETRRVMVASPGYLRNWGRPEHPRDLSGHRTMLYEPAAAERAWTFRDPDTGGPIAQPIQPRFTSNSADTVIALAMENGGICRVPYYQVRDRAAAGELEIVLAPYELPPMAISAVHLSARLVPSKVRLFVDAAASQAARWNFL
jgi:DNA-binding transcriptional LysR family regulator